MKCVIADDHPLFREALSQLIASDAFGYTVSHAENVAALHDLVDSEGPPDILLLDLHMPGATGFSGLSWFVGNYPQKPVIVISANTHPDTVRRAIDHGAAAFLSKSSSTDLIASCLRRVLEGERGLHPGLEIGQQGATLQALDVAEALASLTPQQFRVTSMLVEGMLNKQIAYELNVKEATVKAHMTEIFRKLGVHSRTQAVLAIGNLKVTPLEELQRVPQA
jgi:DNA-binding NarL/FixJ family response regulator